MWLSNLFIVQITSQKVIIIILIKIWYKLLKQILEMKENEKLGENANLIVKTDNPSKKPEEKDESSSIDYKLIFYILLILIIFGVLLFFFFYIHYGSYKVEMLIPENSK